MSETALLELLLRERPGPVAAEALPDYWARSEPLRARFSLPLDRAVTGGFVSDRLGFAFASGYQAALRALVPGLPPDGIASFCVTETGGNHPRAIATRIEAQGDRVVVTGEKRWCIADATELVVVGVRGSDAAGRPILAAVRVDAARPGVRRSPGPVTPFIPEVLHAEVSFDRAEVPAGNVLPGDGYDDYTKPFRTVEDVHVQAALLGYLLGVALRAGFPDDVAERLVALVLAARGLSAMDPRRAETHVALAGFLAETGGLVQDVENHLARVPDAERERWQRDRVLVQVAQKARAVRRERAWETLRRTP